MTGALAMPSPCHHRGHDRHRRYDSTELPGVVAKGRLDSAPVRRALIPPAVFEELQDPEAPSVVREWIASPPAWLQVCPLRSEPDSGLNHLDPGEREAIALAQQMDADEVLLDEAEARQEAALRGLSFIGTLGVLRRAARLDWIDLPETLAELEQTTFHVSRKLIDSLLAEDAARRRGSK